MTSQYKKVQKVLFSLQGRSKTHFETLKVIVKWIHCLPASYSQLVGLQKKKSWVAVKHPKQRRAQFCLQWPRLLKLFLKWKPTKDCSQLMGHLWAQPHVDKLGLVLVHTVRGSCFEFWYIKVAEGRTGPAENGKDSAMHLAQSHTDCCKSFGRLTGWGLALEEPCPPPARAWEFILPFADQPTATGQAPLS